MPSHSTSTTILTLALIFLLLLQLLKTLLTFLTRRSKARSNGCLPLAALPNPPPYLGLSTLQTHNLALQTHASMTTMQREFHHHGLTYQFTTLFHTTIHTIDPANLESVMSKDSKSWGVQPVRFQGGRPFLGEGIFTLDGARWRTARNQVKPALARSQFRDFGILEGHVRGFLGLVPRGGERVDVGELTTRLMMDFSTEYFLGQSVHSLTPDASPAARKLLKDLEICLEGTFQRIAMGMAFGRLADLVPFGRKFKAACKDVHLFVGERMRRAARDVEKDNGRVVMINELVKDAGDEKLILSSATTFYSAGTDTSSITIATILFLLSRHPDVLAKARAEVLDMVEGTPDIETLKKMHYLRAVINETLRLYPVGPTAQRTALNDTILPTGGGPEGTSPAFVKKGTTFVVSYYALHRDTGIWGSDAEEFRPERWEKETPEAWTYQAFGGGLRACPGQQIALAVVAYVLTRILQEFKDIQSRDERPWKEGLGLTMYNANGVHVAFTPA